MTLLEAKEKHVQLIKSLHVSILKTTLEQHVSHDIPWHNPFKNRLVNAVTQEGRWVHVENEAQSRYFSEKLCNV